MKARVRFPTFGQNGFISELILMSSSHSFKLNIGDIQSEGAPCSKKEEKKKKKRNRTLYLYHYRKWKDNHYYSLKMNKFTIKKKRKFISHFSHVQHSSAKWAHWHFDEVNSIIEPYFHSIRIGHCSVNIYEENEKKIQKTNKKSM